MDDGRKAKESKQAIPTTPETGENTRKVDANRARDLPSPAGSGTNARDGRLNVRRLTIVPVINDKLDKLRINGLKRRAITRNLYVHAKNFAEPRRGRDQGKERERFGLDMGEPQTVNIIEEITGY